MGYNSVADNTGLSSFVSLLLAHQSAKFRKIPRKFQFIGDQGHPRSSILVMSIESEYATSILIVTLAVSPIVL